MVLRVPAGVSGGSGVLLLSRRSTDGVDEGCLRLLAGEDPGRRRVVAVTVDRSAGEFVDEWIGHAGESPTDLTVVDVGTGSRSVATEPPDPAGSRNVIRSVEDPGDVASILAVVADLVGEPVSTEETRVVYLDSLGPVLDAVGPRAAVEFVDDVGDLASRRDAVTFVHADRDARSHHTVDALSGLADVVLRRERRDGEGAWIVLSGTRSVDPGEEDGGILPVDEVLELAAARPRRLALRHLREAEGSLAAVDLARRIAAVDAPEDDLEGDGEFQRVYAGLVHVHLPMLEAHGVVSTDADGREVRMRRSPDGLRQLLALTARNDFR